MIQFLMVQMIQVNDVIPWTARQFHIYFVENNKGEKEDICNTFNNKKSLKKKYNHLFTKIIIPLHPLVIPPATM